MISATRAKNEVPVIFLAKNEFLSCPLAASSSGTYAKKFGKENHPKNITLVNDELPLRVGAQSYHQVGDKTLRANRDGSTSRAPVRVEAQSDCQVGEKTLRADRDGSTSRSQPPAVLKGNPKPLAEGKKKSVQFTGVNDHTKDDENHPMGDEFHSEGNKKNDKGSCGYTTTGGKQYQPKQQATTTTNTTAATNSHPTHIPPVSHNDTHQSEQLLPEEEQKVVQTDLLHKKKK
jgi:hypothetical protein